MTDSFKSSERAWELFESGYYKEKEGLVESIINIGEDDVAKVIKFYAMNHPGEKPLTRSQAKAMLDEYKMNEQEWKQNAGISDEDLDSGPGILSWIVFIVFIVVWLSIRYGKLLIATYKKAKIADAMDKRNNTPEIEEKCSYYREALSDLKTCPKALKAVAGTTEFMSAAGVVYLILAMFNFVAYYLEHDCGMVAPISVMFGVQIILGLALVARHKLSAGILFGVQTLIGVFVMCFDMLVPKIPNRSFTEIWRFQVRNGVSVGGTAILAVFLVVTVAFVFYFISDTKNKAVEIILYAGYIGCYVIAHTTLDAAKRLEVRTQFFTSQGLILSVPMLALAWFIILYLMLKGKKAICVKVESSLREEDFSAFSESKEEKPKVRKEDVHSPLKKTVPGKKRRTVLVLGIVLLIGVVGILGYFINNIKNSDERHSQYITDSASAGNDMVQSFDEQKTIHKNEIIEDTDNSTEIAEQVISDTEQPPSSDERIAVETISSEQTLLIDEEESETPTVSMDAVSSVSATSYLIEEEYDLSHEPSNLFDESLANAWVEAVPGYGEGEAVTVQLDAIYKVSGFTINAGYQKNDDVFGKNSRPAALLVTFSDGTGIDITLKDVNEQQQVIFPSAVETSSITLTIQSVYPGSKYEDTVISELQFF